MPVFCTDDGTQHPDGARFCLQCGRALGGDAPKTGDRPVEYKQHYVDWKERPRLVWNVFHTRPHPKSCDVARDSAYERVLEDLRELFADGWTFDGASETAIRWDEKEEWGLSMQPNYWIRGGSVRLRRVG